MLLDVGFDFRSDSRGADPDTASRMLKATHSYLWTKPLPGGEIFRLSEGGPGPYLTYVGDSQTLFLSSDSIVNSYSSRKRLSAIIKEIDPGLVSSFMDLNSTIGGFTLFPGNRVGGKPTINGERGFNYLIADRFDLTLECIRRHYAGLGSPLKTVIERYISFFALFVDFKSYVDFFLLNDLVSSDYSTVQMFNYSPVLFKSSPVPDSVESYLEYREGSMNFTRSRNIRIEEWAKKGQ